MKKLTQLVVLFAISLAFSCSSDDGGDSVSGDPIVGKWKFMSSTENGAPLVLDACDLMETSTFNANGTFIAEDYELENGNCVLQSFNEPGLTVDLKWVKIANNSYEIKFIVNGVESPFKLSMTTVFSNNNNTVTTTATEEDGDVVVSVLQKM